MKVPELLSAPRGGNAGSIPASLLPIFRLTHDKYGMIGVERLVKTRANERMKSLLYSKCERGVHARISEILFDFACQHRCESSGCGLIKSLIRLNPASFHRVCDSAYFCTTSGGDDHVYTPVETRKTLSELVASRVKASTHGRIRNLSVEEVRGMVVVRGNVPSHHTKQLALHGALELLSGEQMSSEITVGFGRADVRS